MKKIVAILFLSFLSAQVNAEWVTSKIDRIQVLPTGNVNFWLSTNATGCGSIAQSFKVEQNFFAVDSSGVKSMVSVLITALTADKYVGISVRDELCRVDSIILHK